MKFSPYSRTWPALLLVSALTACAGAHKQTEPESGPATVVDSAPAPESAIYDALHWGRNAAEARAIYEQTFRLAGERIEELAEGREPGTWAISADADETLIDNSQYEVEVTSRGESFSPETWSAWVERREAPALPGAVEFTRRVKELGGVVAIVTNRNASQCGPTADNIESAGIAYDVVLCRAAGDSEKEPRWDALAAGTAEDWPGGQIAGDSAPGPVEILMWLGDNIGDFPDLTQGHRLRAEPLSEFGDRFFVLPNPIYGSWEENARQ